jgi:L-lactate dehydrogenase (cytochrome)
MATKVFTYEEVSQHSTPEDCWCIVDGHVYDLTEFHSSGSHPGGKKVITQYAGRDSTEEFKNAHSVDIIKLTLNAPGEFEKCHLGTIDMATLPPEASAPHGKAKPAAARGSFLDGMFGGLFGGGEKAAGSAAEQTHGETGTPEGSGAGDEVPPLGHCINLADFEHAAQKRLIGQGSHGKKAWDYYSSGADDEVTLRENHNAFHRLWLKPRVLVNVKNIDISTQILGSSSAFPMYLSAVAVQKLGHPDGELAWMRAAASQGVIFMVPSLSSYAFDEIMAARAEGQDNWFQLYVNPNREGVCREQVEKAQRAGCRAMFITVDAPQLGRRERDMRNKAGDGADIQKTKSGQGKVQDKGQSAALTAFIDPQLCWEDIHWFDQVIGEEWERGGRRGERMVIILKGAPDQHCAQPHILVYLSPAAWRVGVQTGGDAVAAAKMASADGRQLVSGIVVSNHGGRQLDFSRPPVEVLSEVVEALEAEGLAGRLELLVDGGIRRGTDIFKALALGAKAVGIGKPAAYGMSAYGEDGVAAVVECMRTEFVNTMRLMGCTSIADITRSMVDASQLRNHSAAPVPADNLHLRTYRPLETALTIHESKAAAAAEAAESDPGNGLGHLPCLAAGVGIGVGIGIVVTRASK